MVGGLSLRRSEGSGVLGWLTLLLGAIFLVAISYLTLREAIAPGIGSSAASKGSRPVTVEALQRLTPGELDDEEEAARGAFAGDPLDAAAVLNLSRVAEARGDAEASERLKLLAGAMTPRATRIQAEALAILLRRRDFDAVMARLDGLIRARPQEAGKFFAVAAEISADPDGSKAVARLLAENPPWRRQLLAYLVDKGQPETANQLMSELRAAGSPVDIAETRAVIDFYLKGGNVDRGYAVWLSSLGEDELKDVRGVYDGDFSRPPQSLRFDWTVRPAEGLTYRLFPRNTASMDQSLQLDFADFTGSISNLSQILRLRPGRYRLAGEVRFENFVSPTGLVFRLYCLGGKVTALDETAPLPQSTQWIGFDKTFTVPSADCENQLLRLESRTKLGNSQPTRGMVAIDAISLDSMPPLAP